MYGWPHQDLVSAVTDLVDELERCPGCGLTDDEAHMVEAKLVKCVTCEARDRTAAKISNPKARYGWRARFQWLPVDERPMWSAHALFTKEGKRAMRDLRARRRAGLE